MIFHNDTLCEAPSLNYTHGNSLMNMFEWIEIQNVCAELSLMAPTMFLRGQVPPHSSLTHMSSLGSFYHVSQVRTMKQNKKRPAANNLFVVILLRFQSINYKVTVVQNETNSISEH